MSLIKKPAEILGKETIACMIYGQPGMGKTTLACSAPSPVLFDFDGGVARIRDEHQVPTVQITKYQDAIDALAEIERDGGEFKTIVVDTASKMIDSITTHICGTAQPKLQQWGIINATFKSFLRSVQSLGKHIVFIAQREEVKDGEVTRYVPQFRQSNYKDVICDLDVCGYMEMVTVRGQNVRQLTFNPSPRNEGKNTAEFQPAYIIPELKSGMPNTFLADRFAEFVKMQKERAERKQATGHKVEELLDALKGQLQQADDAMAINEVIQQCKDAQAVGDYKVKASMLIRARAKELKLTLNKEAKLYE